MRPVALAQLYPPDTPMAEVAPDFVGMHPAIWHRLKMSAQCNAWLASAECRTQEIPKWAQRAPATPRDNYGLKGVRG